LLLWRRRRPLGRAEPGALLLLLKLGFWVSWAAIDVEHVWLPFSDELLIFSEVDSERSQVRLVFLGALPAFRWALWGPFPRLLGASAPLLL